MTGDIHHVHHARSPFFAVALPSEYSLYPAGFVGPRSETVKFRHYAEPNGDFTEVYTPPDPLPGEERRTIRVGPYLIESGSDLRQSRAVVSRGGFNLAAFFGPPWTETYRVRDALDWIRDRIGERSTYEDLGRWFAAKYRAQKSCAAEMNMRKQGIPKRLRDRICPC